MIWTSLKTPFPAARTIVLFALVASLPFAEIRADVQSMTIKGELRVFDGDTLEIGPVLIRLHGIDAPENGQSCASQFGGTWPCGAASSKRLSDLIDGKEISCDAHDRDPYGRIVASCAAEGLDIGAILVGEGLAWAFIEYSHDYAALETEARSKETGVWQAPTQTAWDYRDDKWNRAVASAPLGCPIKGNISPGKAKRKIYHTPWSPNYGNTKINPEKGERWFCDEGEAIRAGWNAVASK